MFLSTHLHLQPPLAIILVLVDRLLSLVVITRRITTIVNSRQYRITTIILIITLVLVVVVVVVVVVRVALQVWIVQRHVMHRLHHPITLAHHPHHLRIQHHPR